MQSQVPPEVLIKSSLAPSRAGNPIKLFIQGEPTRPRTDSEDVDSPKIAGYGRVGFDCPDVSVNAQRVARVKASIRKNEEEYEARPGPDKDENSPDRWLEWMAAHPSNKQKREEP